VQFKRCKWGFKWSTPVLEHGMFFFWNPFACRISSSSFLLECSFLCDHLWSPRCALYRASNLLTLCLTTTCSGSGKSHTVSTILENMMISKFPPIGSLTKPLCGLVLHFGEGGSSSLPNETAWLSVSLSSHVTGPPVRGTFVPSEFRTWCGCHSFHDGGGINGIGTLIHANNPGASCVIYILFS
jgi:hypothetical protein